MIVTVSIRMTIDGIEKAAELDFDTDTWKFVAIIIDGNDYCYTDHEALVLKLLGGRDVILARHLDSAINKGLLSKRHA